MKKQIAVFLNLILLIAPLLVSLGQPTIARAASARCFEGPLSAVKPLSSCPAPQSDPAVGMVTYSDSGPLDNVCYGSSGPQQLPGGTRRVFAVNPCNVLEDLANTYLTSSCTASGGVVKREGTADRPSISCDCSGSIGTFYNATLGQCTAPPANTTNANNSNIPVEDGPKVDCNAKGSVDLSEENCGIIGLLNTAFNFVSGGVALAVVANIIYAGIQYSTAQGDPSAVGKSKKRITGALIAFIMYVSLYAFIQWLIPGGVF